MVNAFVGTRGGIYRLFNGELTFVGLADHNISAVHVSEGHDGAPVILAGSNEHGLFRTIDGGEQWTPITRDLTSSSFRTFAADPHNNGAILSGTEPGRIFRSVDQGLTWRELSGIRSLDNVEDWYLPYSPRAGAVRNIYAPPGSTRLLASVEVGGLIESHDGGDNWQYLPVLSDTDIHYITGHPEDPNLLFAALGWASLHKQPADAPPLGGVARSRDGGRSWTKLYSDYTRAVIIPPARPDLLLAGPATQVGGPGRIEVSADGGDTWQPAGAGIDSPMEDMVEVFEPAPDGSIWAICSGGRLLRAVPGEWRWRSALPDDSALNARSISFLAD
jgi:photosystem II stability/assembly factor-like uncharacterized protein